MNTPTIYDLTADACRHPHEKGWEGRPVNLDTAEYVTQCVRECTMARDGLNFCAHTNLHRHNSDDIFIAGIHSLSTDEKVFLGDNWRLLSDLKCRLDQLYRFASGGDLDTVGKISHDSHYSEDPRYAGRVFDLAERDMLRVKFLELASLQRNSDFGDCFFTLLKEVEDILVARRAFLIFTVQQKLSLLPKK